MLKDLLETYLRLGDRNPPQTVAYFCTETEDPIAQLLAGAGIAGRHYFRADPGSKVTAVSARFQADLIIIGEERALTPDSLPALLQRLTPGGRIICACKVAEPLCSNGQTRLAGTVTPQGYYPAGEDLPESSSSSANLCVFGLK